MTHLFEVRAESSVESFALPLPEATSRDRLFFELVGLGVRVFSEGALNCSTASVSLSLACSRSFSFCLAALTLALERSDLDSKTVVEVEVDGNWTDSDWGSWSVLELVASC
jgi:hypothetical protein